MQRLLSTVTLSFQFCFAFIYGNYASDWITNYQMKKTLKECPTGEEITSELYKAFKAGHHTPFFESLNRCVSENNFNQNSSLAEPVTYDIEKSFFKLRSSIAQFYKKYPGSAISKTLKSWSTFHFSEDEKETLSFFIHLKENSLSLSSLEEKLLQALQLEEMMKQAWKLHPERYAPFYHKHGEYLIELYIHKKMSQAFAHKFNPRLFHHVENYLSIAQKKAGFSYENTLLHQFFTGDLKLACQIELKAKKTLKPLFDKMTAPPDSIELGDKDLRKNFSFCSILHNINHDKSDEKT